MNVRTLNPLDRLLVGCERALEAIAGSPQAHRHSPATGLAEAELDETERRHAAGLMRINHTGEVCAQALYFGQAALARDADNRQHLLHAAAEETDHLAWCAQRLQQLAEMAQARFGDMVKAVVDVRRCVIAVSGELHSDEEALLLEDGSKQSDLWGINLYPGESGPDWIEFDSMINVRPSQRNRSRGVEDEGTRTAIRRIVDDLVAAK